MTLGQERPQVYRRCKVHRRRLGNRLFPSPDQCCDGFFIQLPEYISRHELTGKAGAGEGAEVGGLYLLKKRLLLPFVHPIKKGAKLITTHTNQHIVESIARWLLPILESVGIAQN